MVNNNLPFKSKTVNGLNAITLATLKQICPEAADALDDQDIDHDNIFWVMAQKPVLISGSPEEGDEVWSETNEAELAVWLSEDWDKVSVPVDDLKVVFLCGSWDDEGGNFWDATHKEWSNYMF